MGYGGYRRMNFSTTNTTFAPNTSNEAVPDVSGRTFSMRVVVSTFLLVLGLMAIVGNVAVVIATFWNEKLRSQASNLLLVYLSMTDAITGLFVIIPSALSVGIDYWPFGDILCKLQNGFLYTCSCSSSFNISAISVDRAIAVMMPLQYPNIMFRRRIEYICAVLFLLGVSTENLKDMTTWRPVFAEPYSEWFTPSFIDIENVSHLLIQQKEVQTMGQALDYL
ncbi:probable G-protein coupled receptor No9 [Uloborus diversus]|uniref:probable G-protein coupled receptor No9 n=1 Tax=Uloborus diversus TaxID=327109 RepID=UPI00240945AC|nr:probable G-protein coupled receptor No9 [Uloborus diversus]